MLHGVFCFLLEQQEKQSSPQALLPWLNLMDICLFSAVLCNDVHAVSKHFCCFLRNQTLTFSLYTSFFHINVILFSSNLAHPSSRMSTTEFLLKKKTNFIQTAVHKNTFLSLLRYITKYRYIVFCKLYSFDDYAPLTLKS